MLFEKIRNHFWLAAMEGRDIRGIKVWKRLARGDTDFKMVDTTKTSNVDFLGSSSLDQGSSFNMKCELTRAVSKGSLTRLKHIFNAHPEAFVGYSTPGYEEDEYGDMSMQMTAFSRVGDLIDVAKNKRHKDLIPSLKLMAPKVDSLVRKESMING